MWSNLLNPKLKWLSFPQILYRMKSNFLTIRALSMDSISDSSVSSSLLSFSQVMVFDVAFWALFAFFDFSFSFYFFSLSLRSSMLILLPGNTRTFDCFLLVLTLDGDPFLIVSSISITQFPYFPFMAIRSGDVCYQWDISHILQNHPLHFQKLSPVALRQAHSVVKEIPPSAKIQF